MMYLAVFIGGALGSLVRELLMPVLPEFGFLSSTFAVNVLACFVLGWLFAIGHRLHPQMMYFGAIGLCGGLSTFSTFAADIFSYLSRGDMTTAITATVLEISIGLCAVVIGKRIAIGVHAHQGDIG